MKVTFLGTGANGGVPQLDCRCDNCRNTKSDPFLMRKRSSFLIESDKRILIECGPDLWSQLQSVDLKLQQIDLIVVSHLHFDHANGLMELSGGKKNAIPVLMSSENKDKLLKSDKSFLVERGFVKLVDDAFGAICGVTLVDIPHDPNFPTSGVVIRSNSKNVWISTDVEEITPMMLKFMKKSNLILFDGTFLNDMFYPAKKLHHMTIEKSFPVLSKLEAITIYTHINHSESGEDVDETISGSGCLLAHDGMIVSV